ncbi:MAG: SIMPL domain-containing protein [Limnobacter sp.]|nr:SIMPL domain-containing protein [Limnobacter sp.]
MTLNFQSKLGAVALAMCASTTWANNGMPPECAGGPVVNLSAVSTEEVQNDQVRLNWLVQFDRASASEAMIETNKVLASSIKSLEKNSQIRNLKNNIQTYPQYGKDGKPRSWTAQGTLSFEMPLEALKNKGSVELEPPMALSNVQYYVGPAKAQASREMLTEAAITEFQAKAQSAAKGFGYKSFQLNNISIQDERAGGGPAPVYGRMYAAQADMAMSKGMEVATSGGNSTLNVSINGNVCLKR